MGCCKTEWGRAFRESGGVKFNQVNPSGIRGLNCLLESVFWHLQASGLRGLYSRCHHHLTYQRYTTIQWLALKEHLLCARHCDEHCTCSNFMSPSLRSREGKQLAQCAIGRKRQSQNSNRVCLTAYPLLFTSRPLHTTSTVGRPGWTVVCK